MRNRGVLCLSVCLLMSCSPELPKTIGLSSPQPSSSPKASSNPAVPVNMLPTTPTPQPSGSASAAQGGATVNASAGPVPAASQTPGASPSPSPSAQVLASTPPSPSADGSLSALPLTGSDIDVSRHKLYQGEPSIAIDAKGNFVVVWLRLEGSDKLNIYAQRYLADGTPRGSVLTVNSESVVLTDTQKSFLSIKAFHNLPQVAMGSDGGFSVLFGKSEGLFLRTYSNEGWPLREETRIATLADDGEPALAALPGGQWVAAWRTEGSPVEVQRFDEIGKAIGTSHRPFGTLHSNRLAVSPLGNFLLVSDGRGQRYDERGRPDGESFSVPLSSYRPGLGMDKDGNFLATADAYQGKRIMMALRFDKEGKAINSPFQVNDQDLDYEDSAQAVAMMDAQGRSAILWGEMRHDFTKGPISLKRYDAAGKALEGEYRVNSLTEGFSAKPSGAMNAAGRFVVAWQNWNDNQGEYRILAKVLDLNQALPPVQNLAAVPVDCSKEALERVAPASTLTPEQEALRQQTLAKPVYTGPIDIRLRVGSQSIDPRTPGALNGLAPDTSGFGAVLVNGSSRLPFEPGTLIASPRKSGCFDQFRNLFEAEVKDQLSSSYLLRPKLSKAPLDKVEELVRAYNKGIPVDITSIEFSSLEAMQTFVILLDILINHAHYVNGISLNIALSPA